jgi:ABC-type cobalamin/Fe3+-siderophores transport system ATPase subunit
MITPLLIGIKDDGIFDRGEAFVIPPDARRKHMAIFGATGAGKSTLLRNMIATDIAAGAGVTVVDPHGGLVDDILENHIPRSRTNDVIHFDPKDQARTLALNILECPRPEQRPLVVSNAVSIFHRLWAESWGVSAARDRFLAKGPENRIEVLVNRSRKVGAESGAAVPAH